MVSLYSVALTLAVFSAFTGRSVTLALPAAQVGDGRTGRDTLNTLLSNMDDVRDTAAGLLLARRSLILDNKIGDEDRAPKVILIPDSRVQGLNPAFVRGLPLLAGRIPEHAPGEYSFKVERREADLDILRCMIGRVYRPCWQS